jgi:hypothetical protein
MGRGTYDRATGKHTITKQGSSKLQAASVKLGAKSYDRERFAAKARAKIKEESDLTEASKKKLKIAVKKKYLWKNNKDKMRNKKSRLEIVTAGDVKEIINIYRFVANIYTSFERMTCKSPDDVLTKLMLEGKFQFNGISGERESINISYSIKTGFKVVLDMESLSRKKGKCNI